MLKTNIFRVYTLMGVLMSTVTGRRNTSLDRSSVKDSETSTAEITTSVWADTAGYGRISNDT